MFHITMIMFICLSSICYVSLLLLLLVLLLLSFIICVHAPQIRGAVDVFAMAANNNTAYAEAAAHQRARRGVRRE